MHLVRFAFVCTIACALLAPLGCQEERQLTGLAGDSGSEPDDIGDILMDVGSPFVDSGTPVADLGTPPRDTGNPVADAGSPLVDIGTPPRDTGNPSSDVPAMCSAQFGGACPSGGECCGNDVTCLNDSVSMSRYCTRSCASDCDCPPSWSCIPTVQMTRVCGRGRTNACTSSCLLAERAQCQPGSTTACCADGRMCGQLHMNAAHPFGCCRTQGACSLADGCCRGYACLFGTCAPEETRPCDLTSTTNNGCPSDYSKCVLFSDGPSCIQSTNNLATGSSCTQPGDCVSGSGCTTQGSRRCVRFCRVSNPSCPSGQICIAQVGDYGSCVTP